MVNVQIETLLKLMVQKGASDLHISVFSPPQFRIDEQLVPTEFGFLTAEDTKRLAYSMLKPQHIEKFERELELDISFGIEGLGRFRVNVFLQRGYVGAAVRLLPLHIMSFEECGLPLNVVEDLCKRPKGLVLVTGATGSGKSTTLASMVDKINSERNCHIVIVEDPIEYVHKNKKALVDQREVGPDTQSFAQSLKHVLRQDPNVILIGEMRDLETIEAALDIAETGHLVLSTLHTSDAVQTINRVIDVFPSHQQQQVRIQLSFVLLGILAQQLIPKATGHGRVLATEVLIATPAVRSLIREAKTHQLYSVIQTSQKEGMRTMNQTLFELYNKKLISYEDAILRSTDPDDLDRLFRK
ncbi:MAG: type IV pilus twitching motility protein PilT [Candidatus Omnitrophica bacterium]|nr:type IV pilus twitching motility protein PilT [Candidatus Omnitrophota bacterium]